VRRTKLATAVTLAALIPLASCAAALVGRPAYSAWESHRTGRRVDLARQAEASARAGDCPAARKHADELRALSGGTIDDPELLNDVNIQRCFTDGSDASSVQRPSASRFGDN